jgi:3'-phosphoadenosine 5'-phosphosulfate (PAPS) 3'-phosphatase
MYDSEFQRDDMNFKMKSQRPHRPQTTIAELFAAVTPPAAAEWHKTRNAMRSKTQASAVIELSPQAKTCLVALESAGSLARIPPRASNQRLSLIM